MFPNATRNPPAVFGSHVEMIGNTPIYQVRRWRAGGATLHLKLEQFNPGGSVKDRTAWGMLRDLERAGRLCPGMRLIESSSGNTAIGLAILGAQRGYPVTAICDRHLPGAKRARLLAFGADIVFLPETPVGVDTVELRIALADYLARIVPNCISPGQFSNTSNPAIHYETTGPEIWRDMGGRIDALVASVGTCGTISGVGRYLKEQSPAVRIIAVEPKGSVIFGGEHRPYLVQGGGLSFVPRTLDRSVIDEARKVSDADAIRAAHEVAQYEGWMLGGTGGLVAHVLGELAIELGPGRRVVGIIPDAGERYLDTVYDPSWLAREGFHSFDRRAARADSDLAAAVQSVGCSLNVADSSDLDLAEFCRRIGIAVPEVALAVQ